MIRRMQFELHCTDSVQFAQQIAELAESLTVVNMWELANDGDRLPCCLQCGQVRYEPPTHCDATQACQLVRDARGIYKQRAGTCLDLACERAARLRLAGHDAHVVISFAGATATDFHAYVESSAGNQDPAAELQALGNEHLCGCPSHE